MRDPVALTTPPRRSAWPLAGWLLLSSFVPGLVAAEPGCLERAAEWANVHPTLLRAIAWAESEGNPSALNWNKNGSYDIGLMQINSWWYPRGLASIWPWLGNPCVNAAAGTWVLKQCVREYGYTWEAIGCYHAGAGWARSPKRRRAALRYIRRVQRVVMRATGVEDSRFLPLIEPLQETRMATARQSSH